MLINYYVFIHYICLCSSNAAYLPASSASRAAGKQDGASNGTTAAASCPALLVRVEHVELSVDLMRETAVVSGASPEDKVRPHSHEKNTEWRLYSYNYIMYVDRVQRPMFVEISLVAGPSREALGPRYKTQPLSGRELNFAYTVSNGSSNIVFVWAIFRCRFLLHYL